MSAADYTVKITGISAYQDSETAMEAFAKLFKISKEKAEQTMAKAPVVIKNGVDASTAEKFRGALVKIGVECLVEGGSAEVSDVSDDVDGDVTKGVTKGVVKESITSAPQEIASTVESKAVNQINADKLDQNNIEPTSADNETPPEVASIAEGDEKSQPELQFKIEGRPDYSFVTVQLPADQTIKVEASAMATMDTYIRMKTKLRGGLGRFISGESLFINEFTAEHGAGEIGIAPSAPGDMTHVFLDNDTIFLQNSAYVASGVDVAVETKWQGLTKGFFSGENLFLIRCSGKGDLWFNTYGAMLEIDVAGDYVVDTGNIVAFTEGLDYDITKVGGYKSLFFSGEGFVCRFSGQGKVWIQTRGVDAFAAWAHWFRPVKKKAE